MKLYELPAAFARLSEALVETGGELTPEMEAEFGGLLGALVEHADDAAATIQEIRANARMAREESARLRALGETREHAAERLAGLLKAAMEAAGEHRIVTGRFRLSVAKSGRPRIAWGGLFESLPEEFRKTVVSEDKEAAYRAWKAKTLPEGFIVSEGTHLRIG